MPRQKTAGQPESGEAPVVREVQAEGSGAGVTPVTYEGFALVWG